eukprot:16432145-Heterocapsa_arctica.AAC.1
MLYGTHPPGEQHSGGTGPVGIQARGGTGPTGAQQGNGPSRQPPRLSLSPHRLQRSLFSD